VLRRRAAVERARHHLLAGAALAGDEDGRVGLGHPLEQRINRLHGGAGSQELVELLRSRHGLAQPLDLVAQVTMLDRSLEGQGQGIDVEGLGDEVVGPGADGRDRGFQAAECGYDHDRQVGAVGHHALAKADAGHPPHVQVGDDDVEVGALHGGQRLFRHRERAHLESTSTQSGRQHLTHREIVVHHHQSCGRASTV
jgi:hypothetical protein